MNESGVKKHVPLAWRAAIETYIPKVEKPVANSLKDFRPIALANVEGKVFWSLVSQRLISHLVQNNKFVDTSVQKGCLEKTPGVWEHVSMVWSALQDARLNSKDLATVWLDIANAYGSIPHQLIFFALERYGVSKHYIKLIRKYYDGLWSKSFSECSPSSWHQHQRGIFAGCTVSIALFIAGMNIVIEYVSNCPVEHVIVETLNLPRLRAFMDDINLMSRSVSDTSVLLERSCTVLTWARMEFKASKSRYVVIKAGRTVCPAISPFGIPVVEADDNQSEEVPAAWDSVSAATCLPSRAVDFIPSIHNNPVRFLGRIIDGSLTDRKNTEELGKKVEDGLLRIDRCSLKGAQKLWICHNLLMQRARWSLLIYEIPMSTAAKLEKRVSLFTRKWLGISKSMSTVCLYSASTPCPLPLQSVTSMLKSAKVSGYQQLKYSSDPLVSRRAPSTAQYSTHKVTTKACNDAELMKLAMGIQLPSEPHMCPVSGLGISEEHMLPCLKVCPIYNFSVMSGTPVTLKAGTWSTEKASGDAECEVQMKKILGVTSTSRAGLGSLNFCPIPDSKHSKDYRKEVGNAVKAHTERELSAKAAHEGLQCQWSNWSSYIQNDLRWADILAMPPNLLAFSLNATFNTLPSPAHLERMKIQTESSCALCGRAPCTVKHILSGCNKALHQGRYEFRHDNVLRDLLSAIKGFIEEIKDQELQDHSSGVRFVREGKGPQRIVRSQRKDGLLRLAQDWKVTADLDEQKNYVFPSYLATTGQRPDILLESASTRRVLLIELTCPSEENLEWANQRKRRTYKDLIRNIKANKWFVDYFPIEVGARGYCAENVRGCLSRLGLPGKKTKALLKDASRTSLVASFTIWLSRGSVVWNPEGGPDVPADPGSIQQSSAVSSIPQPAPSVSSSLKQSSTVSSSLQQSPDLPLRADQVATQITSAALSSRSTVAPTHYSKLLESRNKAHTPASAQIPPPAVYTSDVPATAPAKAPRKPVKASVAPAKTQAPAKVHNKPLVVPFARSPAKSKSPVKAPAVQAAAKARTPAKVKALAKARVNPEKAPVALSPAKSKAPAKSASVQAPAKAQPHVKAQVPAKSPAQPLGKASAAHTNAPAPIRAPASAPVVVPVAWSPTKSKSPVKAPAVQAAVKARTPARVKALSKAHVNPENAPVALSPAKAKAPEKSASVQAPAKAQPHVKAKVPAKSPAKPLDKASAAHTHAPAPAGAPASAPVKPVVVPVTRSPVKARALAKAPAVQAAFKAQPPKIQAPSKVPAKAKAPAKASPVQAPAKAQVRAKAQAPAKPPVIAPSKAHVAPFVQVVSDQLKVATGLKPQGLANEGNTCYLNGLMQALLAVPTLWLPSVPRLHLETGTSPIVRKLLETLVSMDRVNRGMSGVQVDTKPLLQELQRVKAAAGDRLFRWRSQNDAAEVLSTFVDELRKSFGRWEVVETDPHEHLSCRSCNASTAVEAGVQPYLILEPKEQLDESLKDFTWINSEGRSCTSCRSTEVRVQRLLHRSPKVLVIQLNRSLADGSNRKNPTVVDVSSQSLQLPTRSENRLLVVSYSLKAVVCHHSDSMNKGHYVTYAKHGNTWYRFDDTNVRELSPDTVANSINTRHACMYVFEKSSELR